MGYFPRHYNRPGSVPGVLSFEDTLPEPGGPSRIQVSRYAIDSMEHNANARLEQILAPSANEKLWVDISGKPDAALLKRLGELFGLHTLALEDVVHEGQRPKVELFEDHLFVILNMPLWNQRWLAIEQVSLFLGRNFVISVHANSTDMFEPVRRRLEISPGGRIRGNDSGYLLYTLIDLVVDHGFPVLESYSEELQEIESILITDTAASLRERIHETRRELVFLQRALWSQRDAISSLLREDIGLITNDTRLYLRDCHDHAVHVLQLVENYRDVGSALLEMQMTNIDQRTQESLRTLTVIATIFMPLSFIVGLYGMNFDTGNAWNMPELGWRYGYLFVWGVMVAVVAGMVVYFKRKGLW